MGRAVGGLSHDDPAEFQPYLCRAVMGGCPRGLQRVCHRYRVPLHSRASCVGGVSVDIWPGILYLIGFGILAFGGLATLYFLSPILTPATTETE